MKRLLFIGHDASRTGAPFVLLHLLRWIRQNRPDWQVDLILLHGGQLEADYREVAEVVVLPPWQDLGTIRNKLRKIRSAVDPEIGLRMTGLPHFRRKYGAVVGNTVVTLFHLNRFRRRGFWTCNWVHELDHSIEVLGLAADFPKLTSGIDQFIVGSGAVAAMFERKGIKKPVEIVYEFAPAPVHGAEIDIRAELGLQPGTIIVGACGTLEYRKGTDLFVDLADRFKGDAGVHFLWIGRADSASDPLYGETVEKIRRLGLNDKVTIVKPGGAPGDHISALDVFVLSSREDPFPLVCLEAAAFGKPVVCFADAGGMPEFVCNDAGSIVPFADVDALAAAVRELCDQPEKRIAAGRAAKLKTEDEFSLDSSCERFFDIITANR